MPPRHPHHKHQIILSISPSTSSAAIPQPDFSTQCHYTKLVYLCTHYTFTTKPFVINHVAPCPHHLTNRGRCTNMASGPYEKAIGELCSECRPVSLGVQAHLRSFEVLGGGKKRKREEGEDGEEKDWGVEGEEIKRDLKALEDAFRGLDIKDTINTGNAAKDKRRKDGIEKSNEEQPKTETTELAPVAENTTSENKEPAAPETREPRPPSAPASTTQNTHTTTKPSFLSSFIKIFSSSSSHSSPSPSPTPENPTTPRTDPTTNASQPPNQSSSTTEPEPWISIPQDPDWETVTSEEKKEVDRKLWKDKGEWIKVNSTQEKLE